MIFQIIFLLVFVFILLLITWNYEKVFVFLGLSEPEKFAKVNNGEEE